MTRSRRPGVFRSTGPLWLIGVVSLGWAALLPQLSTHPFVLAVSILMAALGLSSILLALLYAIADRR